MTDPARNRRRRRQRRVGGRSRPPLLISRTIAPPATIPIRNPADVHRLLAAEMASLAQEQLRVILLDTHRRVMAVHLVYQGSITEIDVRMADLFREAIRLGAPAILLVHNHPSVAPRGA